MSGTYVIRRRGLVLAVLLAIDAVALAVLTGFGVLPIGWMPVAVILGSFAYQRWRGSALARFDEDGVELDGHGRRQWSEIREIGFREGALVVRPHGSLQAPAVILDGVRVDRERVAALAAAKGVRTEEEPTGG